MRGNLHYRIVRLRYFKTLGADFPLDQRLFIYSGTRLDCAALARRVYKRSVIHQIGVAITRMEFTTFHHLILL